MGSRIRPIVKWSAITAGLLVLLLPLLVFLLLAAANGVPVFAPAEVAVTLFTGWYPYIERASSVVHISWSRTISAIACMTVVFVGTDGLARWALRESGRSAPTTPAPAWRVSYTLRGLLLILLVCIAGIAMLMTTHQIIWLAASRNPMLHRSQFSSQCATHLREIGRALAAYAESHGNRNPENLGELLKGDYLSPESLVCSESGDSVPAGNTPDAPAETARQPGHCSYLYFGKGRAPADAATILALDPPSHHKDDGITVLYGDGHVEWINIDKAGDILLQHGFERVDPAPAGEASPAKGGTP